MTNTPNAVKRVVLITGCSTGIGKAAALAFVQDGWITYATARKPETLSDLAARGCKTLALDVTSEESMKTAVDTILSEQGSITALVNNAGYGEYGALEELSINNIRRQFETNVIGLIRLCQLVLPSMRQTRRGTIVNISSVGGEVAFPGGSIYHATKHAVEALSDALRNEIAAFNLRVVVIQPGAISTNFGDTLLQSEAMQPRSGAYTWLRKAYVQQLKRFDGSGNPMLTATPEVVGKVILDAVNSDRPRTRYKITMPARLMPFMRRMFGDRVWDRIAQSMFPYKA